jgi:glycosyltransferase involved in cell wall biosynthesis
MLKLAVLATHPIQYQVPLWQTLARSSTIQPKVFYATRHGVEEALDPGFGRKFAWDLPMLEGYEHEFVRSIRVPGLTGPVAGWIPKGLARSLSTGGFDAVLVHGYATGAALVGLCAAWRLRLPVIMRGETHDRGRPPSWKLRLKRAILPQLLRRVDAFLAIGSWNEAYWRNHGVPAAKVQTALYAVDNDRFSRKARESEAAAQALRARWTASADAPVFLFAAKLTPVKAPDLLLRAFKALDFEGARLVFVGSGPMEEALRRLARSLRVEGVHWEGFVNQMELPVYYCAADVVVLPSQFEPWGLVVNEAMACGTPCVVSSVVGAGADLIEGRDTGLVFESGSETALVGALRAAADPETRRRWKANVPAWIGRATIAETATAIESLVLKLYAR